MSTPKRYTDNMSTLKLNVNSEGTDQLAKACSLVGFSTVYPQNFDFELQTANVECPEQTALLWAFLHMAIGCIISALVYQALS